MAIVRVLIEGNKACEVKVVAPYNEILSQFIKIVKPNEFTSMAIRGEQYVSVKEIGKVL